MFRLAKTIVLRKPHKPLYKKPRAWRPIALLNTISKLIEGLIAKRLIALAEKYYLLPNTQMGGKAGRSTKTALKLLTKQVCTI